MNEKEFVKIGEPNLFWSYFYKISNIPRCSGNEKRVREFVKETAESHNFLTKIDKAGNLFVTNSNQKVNTPTLILQSHLDMVCEKNEDIVHNFKDDPLKLLIIEKNGKKWITADGTTLGADDGIGMAYMLTIIQLIGSGKLKFDNLNLNFIFTVNEEGGMFGAYQIDENFLKGDYLINLDSESIDDFTIGCVGGNYTTFELDFSRSRLNRGSELIPMHISIGGLKGGHAGVDINKSRGNSIKILSRILWNLRSNFQLYLGTINGGNSLNAIPREAFSEILIK
ncbi:MAG: M20/M25/M40 family metallo-hydrolase [Candidatus Lokiarchaeota archaeon]